MGNYIVRNHYAGDGVPRNHNPIQESESRNPPKSIALSPILFKFYALAGSYMSRINLDIDIGHMAVAEIC